MNKKLKISFPKDPPTQNPATTPATTETLESLHQRFNKLRHECTNYDELIAEGTPDDKKALFAEVSALIVMRFPELRPAAVSQCYEKGCLGLFRHYNMFETVVDFPQPKSPGREALIRMVTKVLDKDKKFQELLDCLRNRTLMRKSKNFVKLLQTKYKNIYALFVKYQIGELK